MWSKSKKKKKTPTNKQLKNRHQYKTGQIILVSIIAMMTNEVGALVMRKG